MNYLAHLVLAPDTPEGITGALAPDMIRGPLPGDLDPAVLDVAREHQSIDHATDRHPAFVAVRDRLRPTVKRFAGIVADVLFDHILAAQWPRHGHPEPFPRYTARVYASMKTHDALIPEPMRLHIDHMLDNRSLDTYATAEGVRLTLKRMSNRFSKRLGTPVDLVPAADLLAPRQPAWLADAFAQLWPDLQHHVHQRRLAQPDTAEPLA